MSYITQPEMSKVGVISLGCDKNRVDTEKMLARIASSSNSIVGTIEDADIVIINTCAFIHDAKQESIDEILNVASSKNKKIIVTGCLSARYGDILHHEIPEISAVLGTNQYEKINEILSCIFQNRYIEDLKHKDTFTPDRILTTPPHYAYLKVGDGCDNHCTYCIIPSIRGRYYSHPIQDLVKEAEQLFDCGVKEIMLVAQDVSRYGEDLYKENKLIDLLKRLEKIGFDLIQLLYMYPEKVNDELIEYIAESQTISKYIDIPFQHASNKILKLMNRHQTKEEYIALISKLKQKGIKIRSSFIVGFPNESEEDFNELKDFIKTYKIEHAGFFAYSREEGTPADRMKGHINESIKKRRLREIRKIQDEIMHENNKEYIGHVVTVRYDDIDYTNNMFIGHTEFQIPGIDTATYFTSNICLNVGERYNILVDKADTYHIYGYVIAREQ